MREYLKQAFWLGPVLPGLGRVPVNAVGLAGLAILGFGHPAFWLLAAGLEAGYLALVATNPRFQRAIDARRNAARNELADQGRDELIKKLDPAARRRLSALEDKCARVLQISRDAQAEEMAIESSRDALSRLTWIYLKLLVARYHLESSRVQAGESDLRNQIDQLTASLQSTTSSAALRGSQQATLGILEQRRQNLERCQQTLQEVDSDLARIEAQVDL
ncbi:MAG TPA: hypothetical protein VGE98_03065, partial [Thermoanaerobaculia bacterium]